MMPFNMKADSNIYEKFCKKRNKEKSDKVNPGVEVKCSQQTIYHKATLDVHVKWKKGTP